MATTYNSSNTLYLGSPASSLKIPGLTPGLTSQPTATPKPTSSIPGLTPFPVKKTPTAVTSNYAPAPTPAPTPFPYNMGTVNLGGVATPPPISTNINASQMQQSGTTGIIPPTIYPPVNTQTKTVQDNALTSADAYYKALQTPPATTTAEKDQSQMMMDLYKQSLGIADTKQSEINQVNNQFDTVGTTKRISDLTTQLRNIQTGTDIAKQMEFSRGFGGGGAGMQTDYQLGRSISAADFQNNIKSLGLSAQLQAEQGNLQAAKDTVEFLLNTKYKPQEDKLKALEQYISNNEKVLEKQNAKALAAQKANIEIQKDKLATARSNEEFARGIALSAGQFGADAVTINKINNARTPAEAISLGTGFLSDPVAAKIKAQQLSNLYLENQIKRQELDYSSVAGSGAGKLKMDSTTTRQLASKKAATKQISLELDKLSKLYDEYGAMEGALPFFGAGSNANLFGVPLSIPAFGKDGYLKIMNQRGILTSGVKDAENLGTLDSGVTALLEQVLGPTPEKWINFMQAENSKGGLENYKNYLFGKLNTEAALYRNSESFQVPVMYNGYEFPSQTALDNYLLELNIPRGLTPGLTSK